MKAMTLATALLFIWAVSAQAQSAGPNTYALGDTWTLSDGRTVTVVKVDDAGTVMTGQILDCPTCRVRVDKNFLFDGVVTDADEKPVDVTKLRGVNVGLDWKFYDWPLEPKKRWQFTANGFFQGQPQTYDVRNHVIAYEDVKTKAGTFNAFRIQRDWSVRSRFGNPFTWVTVAWWAPDVKFSVKFTTTGRGTAQDWELVSYSLK